MPAGIEFECPHCDRVTKVPVDLAGKQGRCPGCRKVFEVPAADPAVLRRSAEERQSAAERPAPAASAGSRRPPASASRPPASAGGDGDGEQRVPVTIVVGLCLVLAIPLAALILSVIGLRQAQQRGGRGERLAIGGIVASLLAGLLHFALMSLKVGAAGG